MTRRTMALTLVGLVASGFWPRAAEREWQTGIVREIKVERPTFTVGVATRDPGSTVPRSATARETRTYVIDTPTHRLELRQDATAETPRISALVGEPVQVAIDKKTVYIKDDRAEHRLTLRKQTSLPGS